jgi:predicted ArsR family transcriptional regulator
MSLENTTMSIQTPNSDAGLLDLLRIAGPMGVSQLAEAMEVTPTAIRQRLARLTAQNAIQREATRHGRGRPKHHYWLTEKGVRLTGSNFTDLAMALWEEVRSIENETLRRETLRRIARALAVSYFGQIQGNTVAERMRSLAELLGRRQIPISVEESNEGVALTEHACPYPNLADQDPDICHVEQILFSELVGHHVEMTQCRLQGGDRCRFQAN